MRTPRSEPGAPAMHFPLHLPEVHGLSLWSNFAWVLSGNVVYAACQLGMVVALAKLGSSFMLGQFSLGLAIATPILMFSNLHLRAVQATDATRRYTFQEYLRLRTVTTAIALAAIVALCHFAGYVPGTRRVILAVAIAKGIESISDVHYGLFQLNDRLDQTGSSLMLRGALAVVAMVAGLYLTGQVFWGCAALAAMWLGCLLLFDRRRGRRFATTKPAGARPRYASLIRIALPLGLVTTMAAINLNMPRYFIHASRGEHELGIYSAMAYATVAMVVFGDSLGHCSIPRLARFYAAGEATEFRGLLRKLLAVGATLGLSGLLIAQLAGARLLSLFYGPEYAAHSRAFVTLIFGAAIYCVASVFSSGITATRSFRIQVPLYATIAGANAAACFHWVPQFGLRGGAAAMVVASSVHLVLAASVLSYLLFFRKPQAAPCVPELEAGI